jgi:peptidoglycan/LPS O-acetylase OafA/YrhL
MAEVRPTDIVAVELQPRPRLSQPLSLYLDVIRLGAATLVFLSHIGLQAVSGGFLWQLHAYGTVAVVIFFVLSGYVVAYATDRPGVTAQDYFVARLSRMYSVALPTIVLSVLLFELSTSVLPKELVAGWDISTLSLHVIASALFLNHAWGLWLEPPLDIPYWSLSYEMAFYILFGLWRFARPGWRIAGVVLIAALFGPRIVAMFPMWLLGLGCYHFGQSLTIGRRVGWLLTVGSAANIVAFAVQRYGTGIFTGASGMMEHSLAQVAQDYLVAGLFAVHIVGFSAIASDFAWITRFRRPIRWLAGATFSVYLFHHLILLVLSAWLPWSKASWTFRTVLILGTIVTVFALAEITERRRQIWRRLFDLLWTQIAVQCAGQTQAGGLLPVRAVTPGQDVRSPDPTS